MPSSTPAGAYHMPPGMLDWVSTCALVPLMVPLVRALDARMWIPQSGVKSGSWLYGGFIQLENETATAQGRMLDDTPTGGGPGVMPRWPLGLRAALRHCGSEWGLAVHIHFVV